MNRRTCDELAALINRHPLETKEIAFLLKLAIGMNDPARSADDVERDMRDQLGEEDDLPSDATAGAPAADVLSRLAVLPLDVRRETLQRANAELEDDLSIDAEMRACSVCGLDSGDGRVHPACASRPTGDLLVRDLEAGDLAEDVGIGYGCRFVFRLGDRWQWVTGPDDEIFKMGEGELGDWKSIEGSGDSEVILRRTRIHTLTAVQAALRIMETERSAEAQR